MPPLLCKELHQACFRHAKRLGITTSALVEKWLRDRLAVEGGDLKEEEKAKVPVERVRLPCLVPNCGRLRSSRGLCPRHFGRFVYRRATDGLSEDRLVRLGKMLPAQGKTVDDYKALEACPATKCPKQDPDTRWFFA